MRDPNAPLTETQVVEILTRLFAIHHGKGGTDSQAQIARDYEVEKKTIGRIKNGTTWKHLHRRFFNEVSPLVSALQKIGDYEELPEEVYALMGYLAQAKTLYCLDHGCPLYFGKYDWIDGEHSVVSDGTITWEQQHLYNLAIKARKSGVAGHPIFADKAEELPTFALAALMTKPVGCKFVEPDDKQGIWMFTGEDGGEVYLYDRYVKMLQRLKREGHALDIRRAGSETTFVYLTKTEGKDQDDPTVFAALSTLEIL